MSKGKTADRPKRLATHGTACRTDSEDACMSKLRHRAQGAKNTGEHQTPPKPLFAAQRDASGAARRG